jgi:hypothetical protein
MSVEFGEAFIPEEKIIKANNDKVVSIFFKIIIFFLN